MKQNPAQVYPSRVHSFYSVFKIAVAVGLGDRRTVSCVTLFIKIYHFIRFIFPAVILYICEIHCGNKNTRWHINFITDFINIVRPRAIEIINIATFFFY